MTPQNSSSQKDVPIIFGTWTTPPELEKGPTQANQPNPKTKNNQKSSVVIEENVNPLIQPCRTHLNNTDYSILLVVRRLARAS
jgi:hypothetical protein